MVTMTTTSTMYTVYQIDKLPRTTRNDVEWSSKSLLLLQTFLNPSTLKI